MLTLTGGAIGQGLPVAVGAAVACPDRPVIALEADGSSMYTIQSLWTMAREELDVTVVILNNRSYGILNIELARVGAEAAGRKAKAQLDLERARTSTSSRSPTASASPPSASRPARTSRRARARDLRARPSPDRGVVPTVYSAREASGDAVRAAGDRAAAAPDRVSCDTPPRAVDPLVRRGSIVCPVADYTELNRASWDERAPAHAESSYYALAEFAQDPMFLSHVVRFDLPRLGDISGARGVHLQCHIGTDTISLARLGAEMTGLDFSPSALAQARGLAEQARTPVTFVESELYDALDVLDAGCFDLVYTGVGALCWLPSIARWAEVVTSLLAAGGRLFIREFHPMLWTLSEPRDDGMLVVEYPYFEREEPLVFDEPGTYVETVRDVRAQPHERVEPRPRRDHHGPARAGDGGDDARRARQRTEQHAWRGRWRTSGAVSGDWSTAPGDCRTPTPFRPSRGDELAAPMSFGHCLRLSHQINPRRRRHE